MSKINNSVAAAAILLGATVSGAAWAQDDTQRRIESQLPFEEVQPGPRTQEDVAARIRAAMANQQAQSQRERDDGPNSNEELQRELMLAENPQLLGYVDEWGNPIRRSQATEESDFARKVREQFKPEQSYRLEPRENKAVPVGVGLMNAIETNFTSVAVRTSDDTSIIEVEDGHLFITPNSMDPIGLILYEDGVLESQVSLVLVPSNSPTAMIDLTVNMTPQMLQKGRDYRERIARQNQELEARRHRQELERSGGRQSGHTRMIVDTLRPVAQGHVPQGFSMTDDIPPEHQHPCRVPIAHRAGQRLNGGNEVVDVVVMHNDTNRPYQVREEMCVAGGVKAVAIFNASYLMPGEETEVYILRDNTYERERQRGNIRPRLTGRGGE